jgi:methylated-DNA-[protein]-cysteine S-methyltransferase
MPTTPRHQLARSTVIATPIGELLLTSDGEGLTGVFMEPHGSSPHPAASPGGDGDDAVLRAAREQLAAYFAGALTAFDLPLAARGTPFQERVWAALRGVPFGSTVSYGDIARRIGSPAAVRAVGAANGRNPLPIVVPCHRVVGADGSLTGFGGGVARKQWLLAHEARVQGTQLDLR